MLTSEAGISRLAHWKAAEGNYRASYIQIGQDITTHTGQVLLWSVKRIRAVHTRTMDGETEALVSCADISTDGRDGMRNDRRGSTLGFTEP